MCQPGTGRSPGLSPRVRGNPARRHLHYAIRGSIPACAGEPVICRRSRRGRWVYPRVCGGTRRGPRRAVAGQGLSPRVRGNHTAANYHTARARSIPACAGEPRRPAFGYGRAAVYPRVCGGTPPQHRQRPVGEGLSPRVRGNRAVVAHAITDEGSIPACAGEPLTLPNPATLPPVYPRVCGGTRLAPPETSRGAGLSPRVRGNHAEAAVLGALLRSIPACAGEPHS